MCVDPLPPSGYAVLEEVLESSVVLRSNTVTTAVFSFGNASFSGLYINEVGTYVLRIYVLGYAEVGGSRAAT